ncbi:MAG: ATP-binding protein [Deltaproteobacteria bacterium]|nr:ATP-binding protein [Deltaproteobacteria bacterium]
MEVIDRFLRDPGQSFFLFGPRGTGKSTWTRLAFPDALRVDLLDLEAYRAYQSRPERLAEVVRGRRGKQVVVIDEIQKVPDLLSTVHLLIEEDRSRRFVLTGSSARKLRRAGVNLLAGRALLRSAHPFMAAELGKSFRLADALRRGLLPLVLAAPDPDQVLGSYASLYLKEEVLAEGLVRNLGAFARFLETVSFSHTSMLNISNVARECQVERKVVEGYVSILEDLLLGYRVPVFTKRAKRAVAAHPKFYLFDAGVFRSLRPSGPLDRPEEIEGAALEGLVAQHLKAWTAYRAGRAELFFCRTIRGVEVDFVVYGPEGFWAFEVKNTRRVRPEDLRSLRAFRADYREAECILLYRGQERLRTDDILCIPCEEFLRGLRPDRLPTAGL